MTSSPTRSTEVARLVLPAVRWREGSGFSHEWDAARSALDLGVGGFILFGGTPVGVERFVSGAAAHAGRALLVGADLERGAGQQVEGLTEFPPPGALGSLGDADVIRAAAATTAAESRKIGINWVFAPVADLDLEPENPIVQSRSFGADPWLVAKWVKTWVTSCQAAGALACAKHYPGHGRTTTDSHAGLPRVEAPPDQMVLDEIPFRAAIEAGVASIMTAHVSFPALDRSGLPATFSAPLLARLRATGFDGLVVTDAMIMEGARRGREAEAAGEIVRAGVDLLLYPRDTAEVVAGLRRDVEAGLLAPERVIASLARYDAALVQAHRPVEGAPPTGDSAGIARRLLQDGWLRGARPSLSAPLELVLIDDDIGGPYAPSPEVLVPGMLLEAGVRLEKGGTRVVLIFAEPRGWKSRAGLSEAAQRRIAEAVPGAGLVVLFGHPRLAGTIPGAAPILGAWHRQRLMQAAVAGMCRELLAGH